MEYNHTIRDIATKTGKTTQSIQKLRNKNSEFLSQHTQTRGRFIFFDDTAFEWFLNYYGIETTKASGTISGDAEPTQNSTLGIDTRDEEITRLMMALEDTKKLLAQAEEQKEKAEEEAQEARIQLGIALNVLHDTQQMNNRLLPPPKQSIGTRIRKFFSNRKGTE